MTKYPLTSITITTLFVFLLRKRGKKEITKKTSNVHGLIEILEEFDRKFNLQE